MIDKDDKTYSISELAKEFDITTRSIRFNERAIFVCIEWIMAYLIAYWWITVTVIHRELSHLNILDFSLSLQSTTYMSRQRIV